MIRGDAKIFAFKIRKNEEYIDGSNYSEIELQFNPQDKYFSFKKLKSRDQVLWKADHFQCYLSQDDTYKLREGKNEIQVRLYNDGLCKGTLVNSINVMDSLSKDILQVTQPEFTWEEIANKPFDTIGDNLIIENRKLKVDMANEVEQDNTKPISSAAVHTVVGNINSILSRI